MVFDMWEEVYSNNLIKSELFQLRGAVMRSRICLDFFKEKRKKEKEEKKEGRPGASFV